MKSILAAILIIGTGVPLAWHLTKPMPECHDGNCTFESAQWNLSESETRRLKIRQYPTCPWWIDPEIWWRESCDGGLPPRLSVPEGLR